MDSVSINTSKCEQIAHIIKGLKLRPSFFKREFITIPLDREIKLKMYIFPIAICHQTHTLINKVKNLKGWEYLEDAYLRMAKENSHLLDFKYLTTQPIEKIIQEFKPYFSEDNDPRHCTLDRLEERINFIIDISHKILKNHEGKIENLLKKSNGYILNNGNGLYELLNEFESYTDPMKKKSTYFIKVLTEAGLFDMRDQENVLPVMDYHMQRVLLRMGCIEINNAKLREKLFNKEKIDSDEEIRHACVEATKLIAKNSGYPIINMNDFFWPLGRSCCKEKILCVDHQCNKKPCTFEQAVDLPDHNACIFEKVCKGSTDPNYRRFWQPIIDTHYY